MWKQLNYIALLCVATCPAIGELDSEKKFTVIGKHISIEEDPQYSSLANPLDDHKDQVDLSTATVLILKEVEDDSDQSQEVELARGTISDGIVVLEGEIDEPTFATISLDVGDGTFLTANTLLVPHRVVSFLLRDHQGQFPPDDLVLVNSSRRAKDPAKRFTIVGDLTGINEEHYPMPSVSVRGWEYDADGNRKYRDYGTVQPRDHRFLIEGEVDEPRVAHISIVTNMGSYWGGDDVIIEPNAVISVVLSTQWLNRLSVSAGAGKHASVIGTWRMSDQYLAMERALDEEFRKLRTGVETEQEEDPETEQASEELKEVNASADVEPLTEVEDIDILVAKDSTPNPSEGCEHLATEAKAAHQERAPKSAEPAWLTLQDTLREIRNNALQEIALNSEDPFDSLLALELNPFTSLGSHSVNGAALVVYDRLMTVLDEDIAARRVKPPRDELALLVARDSNNQILVPGQRAPNFTLPTLEGNKVSLSESINKTDLVYIDFWASWCTPCIEDFPKMKNLHNVYTEKGFEILTVSVDDTFEEWKEAADTLDFPWIDVGSIGGLETETPIAYGVQGVPKSYLVDTNGCIVKKEIRPEQLKAFLSAHYDNAPASAD